MAIRFGMPILRSVWPVGGDSRHSSVPIVDPARDQSQQHVSTTAGTTAANFFTFVCAVEEKFLQMANHANLSGLNLRGNMANTNENRGAKNWPTAKACQKSHHGQNDQPLWDVRSGALSRCGDARVPKES